MNVKRKAIIARIEHEDGTAIDEVLRWYAERSYSLTFTAKCLEVDYRTVRRIAQDCGIRFETERGKLNPETFNLTASVEGARAARYRQLAAAGKLITHDGVTRTMAEWSRALGGSKQMVRERLKKDWGVARAVTTPARTYRR